jgi:uncharacterized damage-inducible protein DinB
MQRPAPTEYDPNYQKYFDLVPEDDYLETLSRNTEDIVKCFEAVPPDKHDFRYAEGKWTVKELLQHIIDTERVFAYRALAAARGDQSPVYRMDEELYASNVDVYSRSLEGLLAEFSTVRSASQSLFENLTDEQTTRMCNIMIHRMSARAIGYFLIAHARHHMRVLRERYL